MPRYADQVVIAVLRDKRPRELWLLEQANDADTVSRQMLHRNYTDADSARYTAHGVTIGVRHMIRTGPGPLPSGTGGAMGGTPETFERRR
jgi:hypothetical protein